MNTLFMTVSMGAIDDFMNYMRKTYFPGYTHDDLFDTLTDKCNIICCWNRNSQTGIDGLTFDYIALQNIDPAFKPLSISCFEMMIDRLNGDNLIFTPIEDYPEPLLATYLIVSEGYDGRYEVIDIAPFKTSGYTVFRNACDTHQKMKDGDSVKRILLVKSNPGNAWNAKVIESCDME